MPTRTFPEDSIEAKAYAVVEDIPVTEMNDRNRLGYHVFLYLNKQIGTLKEAIHVAQARMKLSEAEAFTLIADRLRAQGFQVDG